MKKLIIIGILLVAMLAIAGCGKNPNTIAKSFFHAMESKNYESARQYVTFSSVRKIEDLESYYKNLSASERKQEDKIKYSVLNTKVDGDRAVVTYKKWQLGSPESQEEKTLDMVKEDGDWLIEFRSE